jgi:lipopolysaccharide/colanic/teichoic acid biosynthesis glycosyltransferase
VLDIALSIVGLVLTSPVIGITAVPIVTSPGPVFYRQERINQPAPA